MSIKTNDSLFTILNNPGLMADSYICDERRTLTFLSVWGRDTAVQELLAKLTLTNSDSLVLIDKSLNEHTLFVGAVNNLDKRTTRTYQQTLFGDMIHLWIFDKRCIVQDKSNNSAILLVQRGDDYQQRLWALLQESCTLPLLPHWREIIVDSVQSMGMLLKLCSYGRLEAYQLSLDIPALTQHISRLIRQKVLTINKPVPLLNVA